MHTVIKNGYTKGRLTGLKGVLTWSTVNNLRDEHPVQALLDVLQKSWRRNVHVKMWERQVLGPRSKGTLLGFEEEGFCGR